MWDLVRGIRTSEKFKIFRFDNLRSKLNVDACGNGPEGECEARVILPGASFPHSEGKLTKFFVILSPKGA